MKASAIRNMINDVLSELFQKGLYTPVVSYDGQWAVLAYRGNDGTPLTLLELQKQVYNEIKSKTKPELTKRIFETAVVKTENSLSCQIEYIYDDINKSVEVATKTGTKLFKTSSNIQKLLRSTLVSKNEKQSSKDGTLESGCDQIFSAVPTEVLDKLNSDEIQVLQDINNESVTVNASTKKHLGQLQHETVDLCDTFLAKNTIKDVSEDINYSDVNRDETDQSDIIEQIELMELDESNENACVDKERQSDESNTVLNESDIANMLTSLQTDKKTQEKCKELSVSELEIILNDVSKSESVMSKYELTLCLISATDSLNKANLHFSKYWKKSRMAHLLYTALTQSSVERATQRTTRRRRTPDKLVTLCKRTINKIPKTVLNAVVAEHEMVDRVIKWRKTSPLSPVTEVGNEKIVWFSKPEYNPGTLSYIFSYIDVHHLITNCRVKVCKDGFPKRNINKQAWIEVAKSKTTKLRISHVEDLVDKQSDSIARETFSEDVEKCMRDQYPREGKFCKLIREFYEAEDDPGIGAAERCRRRMELRNWLLDGVNFCKFPPYESFIRDVPNIMFQGFLTNIERRLQIFPFVKSGTYNVRSLGSLEAENLFGQFQDLDPKGTGVVKAEEIPATLENACQLLRVRLQPDRPFHMTLSKARVYPVHELMTDVGTEINRCSLFVYRSFVSKIFIRRDHIFDSKFRSKRKARRRLVGISGPDEAARGVSGVRQFHKCDESKILPHKRLGIDI